MDIFDLRHAILDQYAAYTQSFLTIRDPALQHYVQGALQDGQLWPDALLQLTPAYDQALSVDDLVRQHSLHPLCAEIFRRKLPDGGWQSLQLYRHQKQAIDLAAVGKHYVVTTGTGSGKSMTYMIPIVNHILHHHPEQGKVRALIVYPMNALINSQEHALITALEQVAGPCPVRVARYTGQEPEYRKRELQHDPPHILLTNYVMLELMLTRPQEFPFVSAGAADLQFVVLDELHTYRGRQGADVALLMRRLRERSGNPHVICIGTSATMVSGDSATERRQAVASVATTLFGVPISEQQVIEETLSFATQQQQEHTLEQLQTAMLQPVPEVMDYASFREHPLAHWIEQFFSIRAEHGGTLRRAQPTTLRQGAQLLAEQTGLSPAHCEQQLRALLKLGSAVRRPDGMPVFSFKLHQFISQGSAVYSTLESATQRTLTLEGQRSIDGPHGERLLFPLVFCRDCGQEYALCAYDGEAEMVRPRQPLSRGDDVVAPARAGYLLIDEQGIWNEELEAFLPDSWFSISGRGRNPKREFREYIPRRLFVHADGAVQAIPDATSSSAWFLPTPFLTCLACGAVYTRRDHDDFRKLARLSSEGRSTATTLLSVATIDALRSAAVAEDACKLLSFTDNRQDASLQAGHFNDFASVALLRAAVAHAVASQAADQPLDHMTIARTVFATLGLPQEAYARSVATFPAARRRNEEALTAYLEYRLYEDLRRSWRITQPNLEQCGLLQIDYRDVHALCVEESIWQHSDVLAACSPEQRETALRAVLEHMRRELAIDAPVLDPEHQQDLLRRVQASLKEDSPWIFSSREMRGLRSATRFVVPEKGTPSGSWYSFSIRSRLGQFLRSPRAWPVLSQPLDEDAYRILLHALLDVLVGATILIDVHEQGPRAVQIRRDALLWCQGSGEPPPLDVIRSRRMQALPSAPRRVNSFFQRFYRQPPESLHHIEGREHTGQVPQELREQRERNFGKGDLQVLFCSPTMELGIDIRDLHVVHMRNVPPTPANYAQRSGRAGRSGQTALVMTYCSTGSGHDQYFFQRQPDMVAGAVAAPQIDLANEDLLRAHVHAIWLGTCGLDLGHSLLDLIDAEQESLPLKADVLAQITLDAVQQAACLGMCQRVLANHQETLFQMAWFHERWLEQVVQEAALAFDQACARWRELYRTADAQLQEARQTVDAVHRGTGSADVRAEAERRESEAKRQKDLLCNLPPSSSGESRRPSRSDTDFYPYRYFASEGFLPGYNFPRLPIRAFLPVDRQEGSFLARPRFLAITEFGPQNVIYHEGQKFRVHRVMIPAGNVQSRMLRAKICRLCGYFHEGVQAQRCEQCGAQLMTQSAQTLTQLFEMPTVSTKPIDRITCEEEERLRTGYVLTSHYQFARLGNSLRRVDAVVPGTPEHSVALSYGPTATIWRINHGWIASRQQQEGFALDLRSGRWSTKPGGDDLEEEEGLEGSSIVQGIRLLVRDTRNLLVIQPAAVVSRDDTLISSLQYALQRGLAATFQLEEQELYSELLGSGDQRRIMFWEAAEGGAGVLRRLVEDSTALAQVARMALHICHFNAQGVEDAEHAGACVRACYRCLLSYTNQPVHDLLNRRAIRDLLLALSNSLVQRDDTTAPAGHGSSPADNAAWPADLPPATRRVLDYIQSQAGQLPEQVLTTIGDQRVHLAYPDGLCVLCPEPDEDVQTSKIALEDMGYTVLVLDPARDIASQLGRYHFWRS